jgi:hypothetical protein
MEWTTLLADHWWLGDIHFIRAILHLCSFLLDHPFDVSTTSTPRSNKSQKAQMMSISFAISKSIFCHTKTIPANLATLSVAPMLRLAIFANVPQTIRTPPTAMLMHPPLAISALVLLLVIFEVLATRLALRIRRHWFLSHTELRCHVDLSSRIEATSTLEQIGRRGSSLVQATQVNIRQLK